MIFSQGWQHFKINKAQVPHPGRPWQMCVIHSLAQLLRDIGQEGRQCREAVLPMLMKCTSGEKAGGREEFMWGISNSFVLCLTVSPSLRQGLSKQTASPSGLKPESPSTHSLGMFGS